VWATEQAVRQHLSAIVSEENEPGAYVPEVTVTLEPLMSQQLDSETGIWSDGPTGDVIIHAQIARNAIASPDAPVIRPVSDVVDSILGVNK
jgi:hypothetical protein